MDCGLVLALYRLSVQRTSGVTFMGSFLVPSIDPTLFEDLGHSTFVPSLICSPVSDTLLFPTWLGHRQEAYELRLPDIKDVESRRPCSFFSMHHAGDIE